MALFLGTAACSDSDLVATYDTGEISKQEFAYYLDDKGVQNKTGSNLKTVLEGYELFYEFDNRELSLIESLRTLRLMHYSAWLARRWVDPAFPMAFSWFNTERYWAEHILTLREQQAILQEPPLQRLEGNF